MTTLDWVHLPPDAKAESLWEPLHDASLCSIDSNLLERTITLTFDVAHLREHVGADESLRFILRVEGVTSTRASTLAAWPGPLPETRGMPRDEEMRAVDDCQAKWREQSVDWNDVERTLSPGDARLDVYDADLVRAENQVALRITTMLDDSARRDLSIRGARLVVSRNDGAPFALDALLALGKAFWEAFAARRKS